MPAAIDPTYFPIPSVATEKNPLAPRIWPGISPESTTALREALTENQKKHHVFFNFRGFHNHIPHTLLTLWALGADASIIRKTFEENSKDQRDAFVSPNPITKENWKDYLGDENYYQAYLEFFKAEVIAKDVSAILEEYIFSASANVGAGDNHPAMLNRLLAGLFHPLIHVGLGVEFAVPGVLAEGLAQIAVHKAESPTLFPPSIFSEGGAVESLVSQFASKVGLGDKGVTGKGLHAFTILARVLANPALAPVELKNPMGFYKENLDNSAETIVKYVDEWIGGGDNLQDKVKELIWLSSLIYGVGGFEGSDKPFNADFFNVTSYIKPSSQVLLLKGYLSLTLVWYIARHRYPIDIARFFNDESLLHPTPPGAHPTPHAEAYPSASSPHAVTPEPWLAIIQSTLTHPDDHISKLQRALADYSSRFGSIPKGEFAGTELKDAELIDGSLFVRAAGLSTARLGWVREGQPPLGADSPVPVVWDRRGLGLPPVSDLYPARK
ncbi:Questin oxidase [Psilocybe cubensis]|uniref:Questin oxidase n=1 Tax=Psilocybe cubensis TaxID=181762 RepID=A0ACB8H5W9_PSICU|nr:Questin oxidase [Psilocybe cubensis]KAH9483291.1 Questin oxidase [Psilocybe cubensis]